MLSPLLIIVGAQFAGAILAAIMALVAWRQRSRPGSVPLTLLMLSVTAWAISAGVKPFVGLEQRLAWEAFETLGAGVASVLYLVFILEYVRQEKLIQRWTLLLLWIVPVGAALLTLVRGVLSWFPVSLVFLLYYYALRLLATFLLARAIINLSRNSRARAWTLAAGALAPWLSNIAYAAVAPAEQFSPGSLEFHPLAYALGGLVLGWGILRYRILEVVPLARDLALENLRDGIIIVDLQHRIVDLNQPAQTLLRLDLTQDFGRPMSEALAPFPELVELLGQDSAADRQVYFPAPHRRYFDVENSLIFDPAGRVRGRLIVLHDITKQKKVEEELRQGRAQLKLIFDYAGLGIRVTDAEGRYQFVNDRWAEMLGSEPEELIGQDEIAFLHPQDVHFNREQQRALAAGEIRHYHLENRYVNAFGKAFWGEITVSATANEKGEIESAIGFIIDITKRKQAELALRETERRFREILENIQLLAVMLDAEGNITFCNNHLLSVTGWRRDELLGRNWFTRFLGLDESVQQEFSRAVRRGTLVSRNEGSLIDRDGQRVFISWSNILLKDENGVNIGMASLGEDVTERRLAHDAEREQRLLAESLTDTSAALVSTLNLNETLSRILKNVGKVVPHDAANVGLLHGKYVNFFRTHVLDGGDDVPIEQLKTIQIEYKRIPSLREMYLHKSPVVISNTQLDPNWVVTPDSSEVRSYIGAPILVNGKVAGFLSLNSEQAGFFNQSHIQRLEVFCAQAAVAINNSRLYERSRHELEERRKAQYRLRRVNKRLETQIAETEILQAKLREQVIRDPLTGLYNRRYLDETMAREVARAERDDLPIAILMFDIDRFKSVNDNYGHEAGDLLLKSLAELLLKESRRSDIACRFGGEEFCVVMPGAPLEIARMRAEAWRKAFQTFSITYKQHTLQATVSIGVAVYPEHGRLGADVLHSADSALYIAKNTGRNKVVVAPMPETETGLV